MRILILGAGAIGGYFGARLIETGVDVTFLVRPSRAQQLSVGGLVVESDMGNFRQPVPAITPGIDYEAPDLIIIACKAFGLENALRTISSYVGPKTVVLPLLNGLAHLEIIRQRFPQNIIWGGLAHIGVTLSKNGVIQHMNETHMLMFGPLDRTKSPVSERFLAILKKTQLDVQYRTNIVQDLWDKLVFLTTLAGATCLMRANIGTILETTYGKQIILGLLEECRSIALAMGFSTDAEQSKLYRQQLTERGSTSTASMLRDIEGGRQTEAEHIIGDMVSKATRHKVETPLLAVAYAHLQAYEIRRSALENVAKN